jgi:hypothetical protein
MGKGIGATGGIKGNMARVKSSIASRKAASVAAAAGGPTATSPTAGKPMGVMSNGPAAAKSGMGIKARSNAIGEAFKTGGPKAASKAMRAATKKPFGTL